MTNITKCYTRAAMTSAIARIVLRSSVPYSIAPSDFFLRQMFNNDRTYQQQTCAQTENRKTRFARMLSRSIKTGLFEIVETEMLHTPKYDVRTRAFCGPTAMSAVTGLPISQIREAIRKASGKETTADGKAHPVMGISNKDMLAAMNALGWQAVEKESTDNELNRRDLFRWEDFIAHHSHRGPFIVEVTGHYIAVSQGEVCDTYTKLPIDIARWKRGRRRWVKAWWRFEPLQ